jgi:hypothetical protein
MKVHATRLWGGFIPAVLALAACSGAPEPTQDADQELRGCVRRQPALKLRPSESEPVTHGTTVTYQVTLTNRDNPRCSPAQILYGEWESSDGLTVEILGGGNVRFFEMAPGESLNIDLHVTSLMDAQAGALPFQIIAGNYTAAESRPLIELIEQSTKVHGVYQLVGSPPCQRNPPSFSVTPNVSAPVPLGTTVDYEARVVNNDSAACPSQSYFYGVPPMQWGEMIRPPPGMGVSIAVPTTSAPTVGAFYDVPPGGSAVGAFQVFSGPPVGPGITEFPFYLSLDAAVPIAIATVGYHVAEMP